MGLRGEPRRSDTISIDLMVRGVQQLVADVHDDVKELKKSVAKVVSYSKLNLGVDALPSDCSVVPGDVVNVVKVVPAGVNVVPLAPLSNNGVLGDVNVVPCDFFNECDDRGFI